MVLGIVELYYQESRMRIKVEIGGSRLVLKFLYYGRKSPAPAIFLKQLTSRYQAALPDELDLRPGMKLKVLRLYDDAWGTARIVSGGQEGDRVEGSFPIVSLSHLFLSRQLNLPGQSFPASSTSLGRKLTNRYAYLRDPVSELHQRLAKDPLISLLGWRHPQCGGR